MSVKGSLLESLMVAPAHEELGRSSSAACFPVPQCCRACGPEAGRLGRRGIAWNHELAGSRVRVIFEDLCRSFTVVCSMTPACW